MIAYFVRAFQEDSKDTSPLDLEQIAEASIAAKEMGWSVNPPPKEEGQNG